MISKINYNKNLLTQVMALELISNLSHIAKQILKSHLIKEYQDQKKDLINYKITSNSSNNKLK